MGKKRTPEQFLEDLRLKNPNYPERIRPTSPYTLATDPIDVLCLECGHTWTTTPHVLLRGTGCPQCAGNVCIGDEVFQERLKAANPAYVNGDFELIAPYRARSRRVKCRCLREGCGHVWDPLPDSLLDGGSCPKCARGRGTSRTQEFLAAALRSALGDDAVISRDKKAIGRELDILVPSAGIAVEPGSLFWHSDIVHEANAKTALCSEAGIKLIGITDGCGEKERPEELPDGWHWFADELFCEPERSTLKKLAEEIVLLCDPGFDMSRMDWDAIILEACDAANPRGTKEFLKALGQRNTAYAAGEFEVVSPYVCDGDKVACKCKLCGHGWEAAAGSLLAGSACPNFRKHPGWVSPRQLGPEVILERIAEKNPGLGEDYRIVSEFAGTRGKVECECLKGHGRYTTTIASLLCGSGCPTCGYEHAAATRRKTKK